MARSGTPLFTPSQASRIDLFALAAGYRLDLNDDVHEVRHLHILADLRRPSARAPCARHLAGSVSSAIEFCAVGITPEQATQWLGHLSSSIAGPCAIHLVLALPDHSAEMRTHVTAILSAIRLPRASTVHAVVGVANEPEGWDGLPGLDHFVRPAQASELSSAAQSVFLLLASLCAPTAPLEFDIEDLLAFTGSAQTPASVVTLPWHLPGWEQAHDLPPPHEASCPAEGSLGGLVPSDVAQLRGAAALLACPLWSRPDRRTATAIASALSRWTAPCATIAINRVEDFWSAQMLRDNVPKLAVLLVP